MNRLWNMGMLLWLVEVLLVGAVPAHATEVPGEQPSAHIVVHADEILGRVNHQVFGQNIGDGNGADLWNFKTRHPASRIVLLLGALRPGVLRYPGGTNVRRYFWDKAVGPVEQRAKPEKLGLDEFLTVCRRVKAQPDITINMTRAPADAAALVEYLNAPATPEHSWAMKRKAWGHPEPWGVKYFELGNETYYVDTPKEYAQDLRATAKAMRAVDPNIKLGFVTSPLIHPLDSDWNITVMTKGGGLADFAIVHNYPGWYDGDAPGTVEQKRLMRSIMASAEQTQHRIGIIHQMMQKYIGHDLPIAVTEYNAGFVQDKPKPLRFSLGAALFSADYRRVLLESSVHVTFATYWHFLNGYWGMIRTPTRTHADHLKIMPAYLMFRLWGEHFGEELIVAKVTGPKLTFEGRLPITWPALGDHYQAPTPISTKNLVSQVQLEASKAKKYRVEIVGDNALKVTLDGLTGQHYPVVARFTHVRDVAPFNTGAYQIRFEARYVPAPGSPTPSLGLGLEDIRGWSKTHSGIGIMGAEKSQKWQTFHGTLDLLPDAPGGARLLVRIKAGGTPVSGTLQIRNIRVIASHRETYPAYAAVTTCASLSKDGKTLSLMVFNKTINDTISTRIDLRKFAAGSAKRWTVNAPHDQGGLDTMTSSNAVLTAEAKPVPVNVEGTTTTAALAFPAHSMTAIEFEARAGVKP